MIAWRDESRGNVAISDIGMLEDMLIKYVAYSDIMPMVLVM
jgi:hypothetical protein